MTTTLPLIGLTGRKRSGKNRTASLLAGYGYTEAAFADPLRDFLEATNPVVGHELVGPYKVQAIHWRDAIDALGYELAKERYPELRRVMQDAGTEGMREVLGNRYGLEELLGLSPWVALGELRIERALHYVEHHSEEFKTFTGRTVRTGLKSVYHWHEPLAFTDVRFPNEADLIRKHGGIVVRVARPALAPSSDVHTSETAMDNYDVDATILNDGTPRGLELAVTELVEGLE